MKILALGMAVLFVAMLYSPAGAEKTSTAMQITTTAVPKVVQDSSAQTDTYGERVFLVVVEKLLGWQALGLAILAIFLIGHSAEIKVLLSKGSFEVELWGQKIKVRDAVQEVQENSDSFSGDIASLKDRLEFLERDGLLEKRQISSAGVTAIADEQIKEILIESLKSDKFEWRTIERLSEISNASQSQVRNILRSIKGVEIKTSRLGREIARFKKR